LINRINHHIYSTEFLNKYQYGIIPQTSTIDAIMAVKEFVHEGFSKGEITVRVSPWRVRSALNGHLACLETYKKADAQESYITLQKTTSANEEQP
jgi:hypothetical protein